MVWGGGDLLKKSYYVFGDGPSLGETSLFLHLRISSNTAC